MQLFIILASFCIVLTQCELSTTKRPQTWEWGYNNPEPAKNRLPLRTLKIQIRNGAKLPPGLMIRPSNNNMMMAKQRIVQRVPIKIVPISPMKIKVNGASLMLKRPLIVKQTQIVKGKIVNSQRPFQSSVAGPHTGEYVFENPFATNNNFGNNFVKQPIENTISLTSFGSNSGPIHTIPAPNLSGSSGQFHPHNELNFQHDNHLSLTDGNAIAYHHSTVTPIQVCGNLSFVHTFL